MPKKLEDCVEKLIAEGKEKSSAYAICTASLDAINNFKYEICPDSGFMRVIGICARSGIQEYNGYELGKSGEDANKVFNVYRPKDEVIASLSSYNGAVVTNNHPNNGIILADESDLIKGNVSEANGFEDGEEYYIIAKATITDSILIDEIMKGKRELSAGYSRDLVEESGEHNGTPYQFVQKNIKVNHVAVVDEGRCGATCKLNLDKKGKKMDGIKLQVDGKSVTMDEAAVVSYVSELKTQRDEAMTETETVKTELDAEMTEKEALVAQIAELTDKLATMISMEEAEGMAAESSEIEADAKELEIETKEKSNDGKRREILGALSDGKQSMDSLAGDSLKMVYRISVDQAKKAKKLQADGYRGTEIDGKPVQRTGNFQNDLNAVAKAARKDRGAK